MMMFGTQLDEITDINVFRNGFTKLLKYKNEEKQSNWNPTELELLNQLDVHLKAIKDLYNKDYNKYVKIMKENYDLNKYDIEYEKNEKVVYYIGDKDSPMRKLRNKWTGPWRVTNQLYPNTVILMDDKKGEEFSAQLNRVKKYNSREFWTLSQYEKLVKNNEIDDLSS